MRRELQSLCAKGGGTIWNALRYRVAAPSIRFVPWAALASCWPLPQQLLPVSAAGGGRRRCTLAIFSGIIILFSRLSRPAGRSKRIFTGGVVTVNGIYSAAFCESAALWAACSPSPSRLAPCHLSQRERLWRNRTLCTSAGNCTAMPRAPPLRKDFPRSGGRCRAATKGGIWRASA